MQQRALGSGIGLRLVRLLGISIVLAAAWVTHVHGQSATTGRKPKLRIAYCVEGFGPDGGSSTRRSAFEPWIRELMVKAVECQPEAEAVGTWRELVRVMDQARLKSNTGARPPWDIFALHAYEFAEVRKDWNLEPILVPEWQEGSKCEYGLYVAAGANVSSLKDLYRRNVIIETGIRGDLARIWLANVVRREMNSGLDEFGGERPLTVGNPLAAALPVFFHNPEEDSRTAAVGCVITAGGMRQIARHNPEFEKRLVLLEKAPPMLTHVIACRADLAAEVRSELITLSRAMSARSQDGKVQRMIPFQDEFIETVEKEWKEYKRHAQTEILPGIEPALSSVLESRGNGSGGGTGPVTSRHGEARSPSERRETTAAEPRSEPR